MRVFIDTEFIEDSKTIDLISIGMVNENGKEYYAINSDCKFDRANDWVKENVFPPIGLKIQNEFKKMTKIKFPKEKTLLNFYRNKAVIAKEIELFLKGNNSSQDLEIWCDYGHYDYVVICQLYGEMIDLPDIFPYYFNDIQSLARQLSRIKNYPVLLNTILPPDLETDGNHNALLGAKSCKLRYEYLEALMINMQNALSHKTVNIPKSS